MQKTYKREISVAFAVAAFGVMLWGMYAQRPDIIDAGQYLFGVTFAGMAAAFGADTYSKQVMK